MATTNLIDKIDNGLNTINDVGKRLVGHGDQFVNTPFRQKVYVDAIAATQTNPSKPPFPFNYGTPDHLGYSIGIAAAAPVIALAFSGIDYLLEKQEKERATNSYAIQHAAKIYDLKLDDKLYWELASEQKNIDQKTQEDVRHIEDIEDDESHQAVINPAAYSKKAANRQFILAGLKLHKIVNTKLGNIFKTKQGNTDQLYKLVDDIGFANSKHRKKVAILIHNYHQTAVKPNVTEAEVQAAFKPLQNFIYGGDETQDLTENSSEITDAKETNPIFIARAYQAKLYNAKYPDDPVVDVSFKLNFKDGNDSLDFDFIKQSDKPALKPYFKVKANSNFVIPPKQASPNVIADDQVENAENDKAQLVTSSSEPLGKKKPWMKWFKKTYKFLPVLFVDRLKTFIFDTSYNYWMVWFPNLVIAGTYLTDVVLNASAGVASLIFVVPAILPGIYFIGKTITDVLKRTTNYDKKGRKKEIELAEIEAQKQYNYSRMLYTDNYFANEKEKLKKRLEAEGIDQEAFKTATQQWYVKYQLSPGTTLEEPEPVKHLKAKDKDANKIGSGEKLAVGTLHAVFGFLTNYFRAWLISEILVVASHGVINPYALLPTAIVTGICALTGIYYGVKGVATMKIDQVKEADLLREKQEIVDAISVTIAKQKALKEELNKLDPKSELAKEVESVLKSTANMLDTLRPVPGKWERRFNKVIDFGGHAYTVITRLGTGSLFNRTWLQPGSIIPLALGVTGLFVMPYVFLGVGLTFATFMAVFQVCHNIHNQRIARDVAYLKQAQANFHLEAKRTDYLVNALTAEKLLKHKNDPVPQVPAVVPEPAPSATNDAKYENGKIPNGKVKNGKLPNGFHQDEEIAPWKKLADGIPKAPVVADLNKLGLLGNLKNGHHQYEGETFSSNIVHGISQ